MATPRGFRTEIGLGAEDWGPDIAAAGIRRQERAVCRKGGLTQNARPSAGAEKDFGSDEPQSACKERVFLETTDDRPAESPVSVRHDATHLPTAPTKSPATAGLSKAAEGIRTLDLLHGKQTL
jgi:hypothetical protein